MKNTNHLVILAAVTLLLASTTPSKAQYQAVGDDGIAASPKVRQMLNERKAAPITPGDAAQVVNSKPASEYKIVASPKVRQMLNEQAAFKAASTVTSTPVVGYQAVGDDGIAASPKLREMLKERSPAIQIAPLK
jgi:hypothetical protein